MKVLFISHAFAPHYHLGGPAYSVSRLAKELGEAGVHVTVLYFLPDDESLGDVTVYENVDVIPVRSDSGFFSKLARKFGAGFRFVPGAMGLIEDEVNKADLVHLHLGFIYPGFLAAMACKKASVPLIYHARGNLHPNRLQYGFWKKSIYLKLFEEYVLRRSSTCIALNSVERDVLKKFVPGSKIEVIPNGIDAQKSSVSTGIRVSARPFKVLYLGRLDPSKGIELLILAFGLLATESEETQFHLDIAGAGDSNYCSSLRSLCDVVGIEDLVTFHGHLDGEKKQNLLSGSNLFVLPSEAEGLSIAVLEALASALPILITAECGFESEIDAGMGLYCHREPASISGCIREIQNRYDQFSQNVHGFNLEDYSWGAIRNSVVATYQKAIVSKP